MARLRLVLRARPAARRARARRLAPLVARVPRRGGRDRGRVDLGARAGPTAALGVPGVARGGGHGRTTDEREPDRAVARLRARRRVLGHPWPPRLGGRTGRAGGVLASRRG